VLALEEALVDEGVELWYDTLVSSPIIENDAVTGLTVENKSGRGELRARVIVDATGDCDIARATGETCVQGENVLSCWAMQVSLDKAREAVERKDGTSLLDVCKMNAGPKIRGLSGRTVSDFAVESRRLLREHYRRLQNEADAADIYPVALATQANLRMTIGLAGRARITFAD
jgi:hypothetical protein